MNTPLLAPAVHTQACNVLRALRATAPHIGLAAWVSWDGFVLASVAEGPVSTDRLAAMSASLLALSRQAVQEVQAGSLRQVILGASTGVMLLTEAGAGRALVLSAGSSVNVSRVLLDAQMASMQLAQIDQQAPLQASAGGNNNA